MRRQSLVALALLLAVTAALLYFAWPSQLRYHGRTLRNWLAALDDGQAEKGITWSADTPKSQTRAQRDAADAIRQLGAKAVPQLMAMLQVRESLPQRLKEKLQFLLFRHGFGNPVRYQRQPTAATVTRHRAALALISLDPAIRPPVSTLGPLLDDVQYTKEVALVLASLGPPGIPPLQSAIRTNTSSWQAICAIWALAQFPTNAQPIALDIASGLTNSNAGFKSASAWAMTRIQMDPHLALLALTNAANDRAIRYLCLQALVKYASGPTSTAPYWKSEY